MLLPANQQVTVIVVVSAAGVVGAVGAAAASRRLTKDRLILATDPDREGEAIAWHLARELKLFTFAYSSRSASRSFSRCRPSSSRYGTSCA